MKIVEYFAYKKRLSNSKVKQSCLVVDRGFEPLCPA